MNEFEMDENSKKVAQTTTLRQLVLGIDFNCKRTQSEVNWESIGSELGIVSLTWSEDTRLRAYWLKVWYCTDSWVGTRAYFLDGKLVAISTQSGRKSSELFKFTAGPIVAELIGYLKSLEETVEVYDTITDLDTVIPNMYRLQYNAQILHTTAMYGDIKVKIIRKRYPWSNDKSNGKSNHDYFHTVEIELKPGQRRTVHVNELAFEYCSVTNGLTV